MTELKVTVANADDTTRRLSLYGRELTSWRGFWRGVGADLARAQREWWATAGEGSWKPLAKSTVVEKRRLGYRGGILVRTGRLRDNLTRQYRFMVFRAPDVALLEIPASVAYGVYHDSRRPRNVIPRRPLFIPNARVRGITRRRAKEHADYRRTRA